MKEFVFKTYSDMRKPEYQLRYDVFIMEQNMKYQEEFEGDEELFLHCHLYDGGKLIACARMGQVEGEAIRIGRIAVSKNLRGKGYGRIIVEFTEGEAKKQGYKKTFLIAQTYAINFYEKLGYVAIGDEFTEANIPHIKMTKTLN